MTNFALYATGALALGGSWSSRIYATGNVAEATAATAIHTAWGDLWTAITASMPTSSTVTETFAVTLNPSWKFSTATPTPETLAGTSASKSMSARSCPMITWRTTSRAKGKNGRSFLPTAAVNAVDTAANTGELLAAFQTSLKTGATNFFNALVAASLTPVLLDRSNLTTLNITAPQVGNMFRTQKRRDDKVAVTYA
jgi:hypothetical protein